MSQLRLARAARTDWLLMVSNAIRSVSAMERMNSPMPIGKPVSRATRSSFSVGAARRASALTIR